MTCQTQRRAAGTLPTQEETWLGLPLPDAAPPAPSLPTRDPACPGSWCLALALDYLWQPVVCFCWLLLLPPPGKHLCSVVRAEVAACLPVCLSACLGNSPSESFLEIPEVRD